MVVERTTNARATRCQAASARGSGETWWSRVRKSVCALRSRLGATESNATAGSYFLRRIEVHVEAERIIGERAWFLLSCYGKLTVGPHSGSYVSGLACDEQLELVHRLQFGETVPVHLMHRHRSGDYESSSLRWTPGGLVMVFADREVLA